MGKQTRRQRKHLRVKREHAEVYGLPIAPAPTGRPSSGDRRTKAGGGPPGASGSIEGASLHAQSAPNGSWWSSWPLSLRLVVAGIAILVVIGLYRRYTEDSGRIAAGAGEPAPVIPSAASSASDVLSMPADSNGR